MFDYEYFLPESTFILISLFSRNVSIYQELRKHFNHEATVLINQQLFKINYLPSTTV